MRYDTRLGMCGGKPRPGGIRSTRCISSQDIIQSMPHDAHPSGIIITAMSLLSSFYPDANPTLMGLDIYKPQQVRDKQIARILGQAPIIAAAAYLRNKDLKSYRPNPRLARVLDIIFILHAEHEMNCSTAACRHISSSGVDVYTAVAGGLGAIYGPLHNGAIDAKLSMFSEIGSVENIPEVLESVKNKKRKLSGFDAKKEELNSEPLSLVAEE